MQRFRGLLDGWKGTVLPGLLALLVVFALQLGNLAAFANVGHLIFDSYIRAEPRSYEDAAVRIVDIDEETIRRYGQWPWPRTQFAGLVDRLGEAGAASIALDIVFSEPDRTSPARIAAQYSDPRVIEVLRRLPDNDAALAASFAKAPVIAGYFLTRDRSAVAASPKAGIAVSGSLPDASLPAYTNAILPLPELYAAAPGTGFLTLQGDSDGIIRKAPLLARQGDQILPSLSIEALRIAQGAGSIVVKTSDGSGNMAGGNAPGVTSIKVGTFEVPTTRAGELWMHYTASHPERVIPAWKILSGELSPQDMAQQFGGQIVFVGTGAIGLRDLIATPVQDRELGVMVHAQAVEQMVLGKFLVRPDWADGLERTLLLLLGGILALALPRLGATKGAALGLIFVAAVVGGSWLAYHHYRFLLDPTWPLLGVLAVYATETVVSYTREERRRSYIHQAFDRFLSPELVRRIAADPGQLELGGEERQMTVLFADIRSFSRISEQFDPQNLIRFLIGFLTPMCDILLARKATIDKFIGDAILAFWNAPLDDPDQYANAATAALEMHARLTALNAEKVGGTEPWPGEVRIGIGLNAGPCCVGNMGSAQRLSYSLIGDTVNLASRLEGLTKFYGIGIALGEDLCAQIPDFATLVVDRVRVVGRDAPEEVSALVGDRALAQAAAFRTFAEGHAAMLAAYRAQSWEAAGTWLESATAQAQGFGVGGVYAIYLGRIAMLRVNPPGAGWDGVYTAVEK
ncbi:MAG TPA: adenylate/guanylate cyclase domain-containing protein [Novosphingobium sp.]|nr:adenylate/guanylate cyclase domain-containing protein [Novosphingobium sp.]